MAHSGASRSSQSQGADSASLATEAERLGEVSMRALAAFLAIVALPLISPDSSSAQTPGQAEDPAAAKQHAPRGSALELERFGRHILPTRKATASSSEAAGQGAEVSDVLDPKERPSLKFLRQGKTLSKSGKPAKQKGDLPQW